MQWFPLKKFYKGLKHVENVAKMLQNRFNEKHRGHSIRTHCRFLHLYEMEIHRYIVFQTCTNNISIVKPTRCTTVSNLFYFGMAFYMFQTVFPSIISSSRLRMSNRYCCLLASKLMMDRKTIRNM